MNVYRKSPFFLNGKEINWVIGKKKEIWGLPLMRQTWAGAKARLQEIGFIAGSEVLAISGPKAHFRAVIGSDRGVYLDEMSAPWGLGPGNEIYPVRVELTNIQDINCDWFNGPRGPHWQGPLEDLYFFKKSLYILRPDSIGDPNVNQATIFGAGGSTKSTGSLSTPPRPSSTSLSFISLEDDTAQEFSKLGFRIEQLGHKRPLERLPDGIGLLPRSLVLYAKTLNANPYFVVWDCKFDCGPNGLRAEDERAIKEYIESYAPTKKAEAAAADYWFLIVARDRAVADRIYNGASQWTWLSDCQRLGLRGLRVVSVSSLKHLAKAAVEHRQSGGDSDTFLVSLLPRELAKSYLG